MSPTKFPKGNHKRWQLDGLSLGSFQAAHSLDSLDPLDPLDDPILQVASPFFSTLVLFKSRIRFLQGSWRFSRKIRFFWVQNGDVFPTDAAPMRFQAPPPRLFVVYGDGEAEELLLPRDVEEAGERERERETPGFEGRLSVLSPSFVCFLVWAPCTSFFRYSPFAQGFRQARSNTARPATNLSSDFSRLSCLKGAGGERAFGVCPAPTASESGLARASERARGPAAGQAGSQGAGRAAQDLISWKPEESPGLFPRIGAPFSFFASLGSPLFSTHQARKICFLLGPEFQPRVDVFLSHRVFLSIGLFILPIYGLLGELIYYIGSLRLINLPINK